MVGSWRICIQIHKTLYWKLTCSTDKGLSYRQSSFRPPWYRYRAKCLLRRLVGFLPSSASHLYSLFHRIAADAQTQTPSRCDLRRPRRRMWTAYTKLNKYNKRYQRFYIHLVFVDEIPDVGLCLTSWMTSVSAVFCICTCWLHHMVHDVNAP